MPLRYRLDVVLRMEGANEPSRTPMTLFAFNSREDIDQFATGCDADVGGTSTVNFALDESTAKPTNLKKSPSPHELFLNRATGRFWGEMSLSVRSGLEGQIRGGYAGFRSKVRRVMSFIDRSSAIDSLSSLELHSLAK